MSIVTPRLDTSLPSTPSHEWAKDTMNTANIRAQQQQPQSNNPYFNGTAGAIPSNDPVKEDQAVKTTTNAVPHATNPFAPSVNSTASTPGGDVPGSYPRGAEEGSADYAPSQLLESAKQYIPDPNQAQSTLQSMGQTAISYLPASLSGYLPGGQQTSLPSTEKEGIQPGEHQSGIGALPGSINEEGVAKLPEEQARSSQNTRPDMQWTDSNGKGSWGEGGLHKGDEKVADKALQSIGAGAGAAGIAAGVGHENGKLIFTCFASPY
ncbi:hypothetical protein FA95DRAFT_579532 [Auriscalpium vulgare]|uniref:Uncharacterized protein n=1 Tax=Auriscalpium vulgare TaxID=40419 RepID=A0ACB8RFL4_9AGAM|nr:hypothetical protein FA95DRAFT_579532 [Auriscalpium vulgare]